MSAEGTDVASEPFGTLPDGRTVERYALRAGGSEAAVLTYGAVLQSVRVPDAGGTAGEVTLGFDDLPGYLEDTGYLGAVVGRYANRIGGARFTLDGEEHVLPANHGAACLHGGPEGFHAQLWAARGVPGGVELSRTSPDGEMGFPGTLEVTVTYLLSDGGDLEIRYAATTDRPTVVNLSSHAYWNLAGAGTVEDHVVQLPASSFATVDEGLIPTGVADVEGTPMDFRTPQRIGDRLRSTHPQLRSSRGYDHAWVLDAEGAADGLHLAARVHEPASGRALEVHTDQPSVQFYSGNFLDGGAAGRGGVALRQSDGLCLETQHLPDSPNRPEFPTTVLRPGERYATRTVVRFRTVPAEDAA